MDVVKTDSLLVVDSVDLAVLAPLYAACKNIEAAMEAELQSVAIKDEAADFLDAELMRFRSVRKEVFNRIEPDQLAA